MNFLNLNDISYKIKKDDSVNSERPFWLTMDNPSTKSEATIIEVNTKLVFEKFPNIYKQIEKPALPLFITNWLFGIGIIECPMGKPRRLLSFIYSTTILLVYFMIAGYTYPYLKNLNFETMKNIIKILFFSNCFLTITTTALGWYRSKVSFSHYKINQCIIKFKVVLSCYNKCF